MWKLTIIANGFLLLLFWLLAALLLEPAYNHFVQYPDSGSPQLPLLSQWVISARPGSLLLPVLWLTGSTSFLLWLRKKDSSQRREWVQFHTSLTLLLGVLLTVVSLLAGILPFLNIGRSL